VLLLGDSTAVTLGLGLSEAVDQYDVAETDEGILGCGVTDGTEFDTKGVDLPVATPCNTDPPPPGTPQLRVTDTPYGPVRVPDAQHWTVWDSNWVARVHPNVVMVLAGRWEVADRTYNGQWTDILHPSFAAYVKRQLDHVVDLSSANGAKVVLLTAPCYDVGEQPNGQPWPTDSPERLATYNRLVRQVAAERPTTVSVVDLNAMVCPGGQYQQTIDGVQVRTPDGVHFTITGGKWLAPKIWPTVVQLGRQQMGAGSGAATGSNGTTTSTGGATTSTG